MGKISKSCFFALAALALAGCSREETKDPIIRGPEDLGGRRCGTQLGTCCGDFLHDIRSDIEILYYNDLPAAVEALKLGKIDALSMDNIVIRSWVAQSKGRFISTGIYKEVPDGLIFPKGSKLRAKVDDVLGRLLASGDADRIISKWSDAPDLAAVKFEDLERFRPDFTGAGGTITMATTGEFEPGAFPRGGELVGCIIDLMRVIARMLDMKLAIRQTRFSSIIAMVETGKADIGADLVAFTEERKLKVDYSIPYLVDGHALMVRNPDWKPRRAGLGESLASLKGSFMRTFVTDARWKMMASGLGVTIVVTMLATLLGTALAFPVWLARTSRLGAVRALARTYIALLQGTPVLVILMVLFYIVFGKIDIDGIWVATIGFALNLSACAGEMLRSGVDSIPAGQREAALALGYTPRRAFTRFVLPQAIRVVLPVYRGELIGLLKATSVVGYIAIQDLTKACDLVRSRTYESFFPLITTAAIYFAVSTLMASALEAACSDRRRKGNRK